MRELTEAARCAKLIRAELKEKFPKVKFSIRSENFAGGNSVHISWVDGPKQDVVGDVVDKYQDGDFDGMTDCYNYRKNDDNIPRAKYVQTSREISEETKIKLKEELGLSGSSYDDENLVWRTFQERDYSKMEEPKAL